MGHLVKHVFFRILLVVVLALFTASLSAQVSSSTDFDLAKEEITETFGTFPSFFDAFPKHALPGAWQVFKELKGPKSNIDPKNSELIQLAVAAQIPCVYCVYFHRAMAEGFGATAQEIKEAVALGAETRHWSMVIQGAEIDFDDFKLEFDNMMKYMEEKSRAQK